MQIAKTHGQNVKRENVCECLGGGGGMGGMHPQKILKSKDLSKNAISSHSQADSYVVKKVPKVESHFLLNFDKKSVFITCNIFS